MAADPSEAFFVKRILLLQPLNPHIFSYACGFLSWLFFLVPALDQCLLPCLFWNSWRALSALEIFSRIRSLIQLSFACWRMQTCVMCFSALYLYWNTVEKLNILDLPVAGQDFCSRKGPKWAMIDLCCCCCCCYWETVAFFSSHPSLQVHTSQRW